MCAGATKRDRAACEALVTHDAKKCDAIPLDDLRTPCTRDAQRFRAVLPGDAAVTSIAPVKGAIAIHAATGPDPSQTSADLESDIGAGVVVVIDGKRTRVSFGHPNEASAALPHAAQPLERTHFGLAFTQNTEKPTEITAAALSVPGALQSSCTSGCTLVVNVTKLEPKRGGVAAFTVDGTLGTFRVHADVSTFVRDVVTITP